MKTHPKKIKNGPKIVPGAPLGSLGGLLGTLLEARLCWGPFLDRFFDFFSDFGGPWGPPFSHFFGPNFKSIFQTPSVIAFRRFCTHFDSILGAFWGPFWYIFWVSVRK